MADLTPERRAALAKIAKLFPLCTDSDFPYGLLDLAGFQPRVMPELAVLLHSIVAAPSPHLLAQYLRRPVCRCLQPMQCSI